MSFEADLNWQTVLSLARYNQVVPLIFARLAEHPHKVPTDALQSLSSEAKVIIGWNFTLAGELLKVLNLLRENGITAVPFKGPVLLFALYGGLKLRQTRDLDLLVNLHQLSDALLVLGKIGYQLEDKSREVPTSTKLQSKHKDVLVINRFNGVYIDVHWAACEPDFDKSLARTNFWNNNNTITLLGEQVPLPRPENFLLLLVIHGARHHWNSLRLLCDIAMLINAYPDLNFEEISNRMPGLWKTRMFLLPLSLVHKLWDVPLPAWVQLLIDSDPKIQEQTIAVSSSLFSVTDQTDFSRKAAEVLLLQQSLRLDSSKILHDRLRLVLGATKRLVRPNDLDRNFFPLPAKLSPIYFIIRPLRILRRYGFRFCLSAALKLWKAMFGTA